jgi:prenyltransferase beta subunit
MKFISANKFSQAILFPMRDVIRRRFVEHQLRKKIVKNGIKDVACFDFDVLKRQTLEYLKIVQVSEKHYLYRYSTRCSSPTLYASAYACMTLSLYGELNNFNEQQKLDWCSYFDSFQEENGLFYDSAVRNEIYDEADWWGARHITTHMISAYTDLGAKPKHPIRAIGRFCGGGDITRWLSAVDWTSPDLGRGDIDNKIMNIGCLLQYQRDAWDDTKAATAIFEMKKFLKTKINPGTGMWGDFNTADPGQRSRMVQFAYHLLLLYFYDGDYDFDINSIVSHVLKTQNKFGGYGVRLNSSACEDIDSIDILIKLYKFCDKKTKSQINQSIMLSLKWVLINQVSDGGFVFRLNEPFVYGSNETSSFANQGAMMPTWFRSLSIAYIAKHLKLSNRYIVTNAPGYEFL